MPARACQAMIPHLGWHGVLFAPCGEPAVVLGDYSCSCPLAHARRRWSCARHEPVPGTVGCRQCWDAGHECPMTWRVVARAGS